MIRIACEADVPAILSIYAPYVQDTTVSFEYTPPTEEEFLTRFRKITQDFPWLVWEEDGEVLGYTYACRPFERAAYSWCAEPSIYLKPAAHGHGIGRKLYQALEKLLEMQGYRVLLALITGENLASVGFHEHLGYEIVGELKSVGFKFERWLGVFWMEKTLNFVENSSDYPASWGQIVQDNQKIRDILYNLSLS